MISDAQQLLFRHAYEQLEGRLRSLYSRDGKECASRQAYKESCYAFITVASEARDF